MYITCARIYPKSNVSHTRSWCLLLLNSNFYLRPTTRRDLWPCGSGSIGSIIVWCLASQVGWWPEQPHHLISTEIKGIYPVYGIIMREFGSVRGSRVCLTSHVGSPSNKTGWPSTDSFGETYTWVSLVRRSAQGEFFAYECPEIRVIARLNKGASIV